MSPRARPVDRAFRPSASTVLRSPVHLLAFGLGAGLAPKAPGTFGTLVGIPLFWLLAPLPWPLFLLVTAALALAGIWICGESARRLGVHDYGGIVFDEVVGYLVAAAPLLPALALNRHGLPFGLLAAFLLFRLFDIAKPWPISWLDARLGGGVGIMVDDLAAGAAAAAVLLVGLTVAG